MPVLQEQKPVFVPFSCANMNAFTLGVNIAHFKVQTFAQTQAKTINNEVENPITQ